MKTQCNSSARINCLLGVILAWITLLTQGIIEMQQQDSLWYTTYLTAGRISVGADTVHQAEQLVRWQFPLIKLFWTVLWCIKASFLALFFRLVKTLPVYRRVWYGIVGFCVIAYIGCWLASALTCSPPSDYFRAGRFPSSTEQLPSMNTNLCRQMSVATREMGLSFRHFI
jgi:hypothetical protein